ncbi:MAG: class II aldolase/adducin family protein [Deltaproteobacteria bacterium]|jgi:L-fuculose-phosphate aldolase|nr:class II aldolase/adducin family protein [Deltaproteobacteria bacterium]MBW2532264.1 class II aldolase/adducin family protein [Deltaproteobacteria bacterium]
MPRLPERRLREQLIQISRLCYERRLLVALDGNLSVRLDGELLLCTPAGCHKGLLTDAELLVVDRRGQVVRGRGQPTSEMAMHLACYRERPDVEAVVHAHPPVATAFTIAGVSLARCVLPEVVLTLGTVPTLEYDTTGTAALAERVGQAMGAHDAVMLDRHGAVCVGPSLLDAFCKLETMEHMAQVMKAAVELGGIRDLPCDEAAKLRAMGLSRYGGPPEAVARAGEPGADLPPACWTCGGCERTGEPAASVAVSGERTGAVGDVDRAARQALRKLLG